MSFLDELKKQKSKLSKTDTVITKPDGQRYIEKGDSLQTLPPNYGFVVDTKPDETPILITDYLYIGSQDCTESNILIKYDLKHVLSLGIDIEMDVNHKFIQCLDLPETDIKPILIESLPFIHKAVENKENVLIHCNAGVSRTSAVAIGYLMQYESMQFDDAYSLVKEKRPAIQPNTGFKKQLKSMKAGQIL